VTPGVPKSIGPDGRPVPVPGEGKIQYTIMSEGQQVLHCEGQSVPTFPWSWPKNAATVIARDWDGTFRVFVVYDDFGNHVVKMRDGGIYWEELPVRPGAEGGAPITPLSGVLTVINGRVTTARPTGGGTPPKFKDERRGREECVTFVISHRRIPVNAFGVPIPVGPLIPVDALGVPILVDALGVPIPVEQSVVQQVGDFPFVRHESVLADVA